MDGLDPEDIYRLALAAYGDEASADRLRVQRMWQIMGKG